jgi:hypothetical protein
MPGITHWRSLGTESNSSFLQKYSRHKKKKHKKEKEERSKDKKSKHKQTEQEETGTMEPVENGAAEEEPIPVRVIFATILLQGDYMYGFSSMWGEN